MLARKLFSPSSAQLPYPKTPASKSPVSITSKLIENKALQVLYSGHLRKTGGGGVTAWYKRGTIYRAPTRWKGSGVDQLLKSALVSSLASMGSRNGLLASGAPAMASFISLEAPA